MQEHNNNSGIKNDINLTVYRERLINWGITHFRPFPWRYSDNPYHVLIAEILLHRTQAKQVEPVYLEFINRYPDMISLYSGSPYEIKDAVNSLGLYWRADLIHSMAVFLVENYSGEIPVSRNDLLSVPGIGGYIASAVRCFAYGLPDAIIDTNVMRVITRVSGIPFRDSLRRNKKFLTIAQALLDPAKPRDYNFAVLDLANQICRMKRPKCELCPLIDICLYPYSKE